MNKIRVIDLLNKIANGEEIPSKFKFAHQIFEKSGLYYQDEDGDNLFDSVFTDFSNINDEIEIIEEDEGKCIKCGKYSAEECFTICEFCMDLEEYKPIEKIIKPDRLLDKGEVEYYIKKIIDNQDKIIDYINKQKEGK